MTETKQKLNLYVVGESSGNPAEWLSDRAERILVMASSEREAVELADCGECASVSVVVPQAACVIAVDRAIYV